MVMPLLDTALTVDDPQAFPLGVSEARQVPGGDGASGGRARVAVYAPGITKLEVAYQAPGQSWRLQTLSGLPNGVHHGVVDGFPVGSRYGFRAAPEGEEVLPLAVPTVDFDDDGGSRQPLLLDPYGRAVDERDGFLTSVRMSSRLRLGS